MPSNDSVTFLVNSYVIFNNDLSGCTVQSQLKYIIEFIENFKLVDIQTDVCSRFRNSKISGFFVLSSGITDE